MKRSNSVFRDLNNMFENDKESRESRTLINVSLVINYLKNYAEHNNKDMTEWDPDYFAELFKQMYSMTIISHLLTIKQSLLLMFKTILSVMNGEDPFEMVDDFEFEALECESSLFDLFDLSNDVWDEIVFFRSLIPSEEDRRRMAVVKENECARMFKRMRV